MSGWAAFAQAAAEGANLWMQSSMQHKANRTNVMLAREQRAWEAELANTGYRRKMWDLQQAGVNPLLAVGGPPAATPSVSPAKVESTTKNVDLGASAQRIFERQVGQQQLLQASAQTRLTTEQARLAEETAKNVQADTLLKRTTAAHTVTSMRNLETQREKVLQEIQNLVSDKAYRDLEVYIKAASKNDLVELLHNENLQKRLGIQGSEASSRLKFILNKFLGIAKGTDQVYDPKD